MSHLPLRLPRGSVAAGDCVRGRKWGGRGDKVKVTSVVTCKMSVSNQEQPLEKLYYKTPQKKNKRKSLPLRGNI